MTLALLTGPAAEPVTLAEARAHLRLDGTEENPLVEALIAAARAALEAETRRAFVTQSWRLTLDDWPADPVRLPLAPVAAVTAVKVASLSGAMLPIDPGFYETDSPANRRALPPSAVRPGRSGDAVGHRGGFHRGPWRADVPPPLKQALFQAHVWQPRAKLAAATSCRARSRRCRALQRVRL